MTPSFRVIKEAYPEAQITVNTHRPALLKHNPFVDHVGSEDTGLPVRYMDPFHCKGPEMWPTKHHILTDWEIITEHYGLKTPEPRLCPELFCLEGKPTERRGIGVQIDHKPHWHHKRVWPFFEELAQQEPFAGQEFRPIYYLGSVLELIAFIAGLRLVVCAEGGIQHIAAAVGTPAVVIFGGFSSPEWNGYPFNRNLVNLKECAYCYTPFPCEAKVERECMREITVTMVMDAIREELAK